jgi:hypothetical protein
MSNDLSTLEVLRLAEGRLEDRGQYFSLVDWRACTCGHIYGAALGEHTDSLMAEDEYEVSKRITAEATDPLYVRTLVDTAVALGYTGPKYRLPGESVEFSVAREASMHVSSATFARRRRPNGELNGTNDRENALLVIREAIAKLEAHEAANVMRVVLSAAQPRTAS